MFVSRFQILFLVLLSLTPTSLAQSTAPEPTPEQARAIFEHLWEGRFKENGHQYDEILPALEAIDFPKLVAGKSDFHPFLATGGHPFGDYASFDLNDPYSRILAYAFGATWILEVAPNLWEQDEIERRLKIYLQGKVMEEGYALIAGISPADWAAYLRKPQTRDEREVDEWTAGDEGLQFALDNLNSQGALFDSESVIAIENIFRRRHDAGRSRGSAWVGVLYQVSEAFFLRLGEGFLERTNGACFLNSCAERMIEDASECMDLLAGEPD